MHDNIFLKNLPVVIMHLYVLILGYIAMLSDMNSFVPRGNDFFLGYVLYFDTVLYWCWGEVVDFFQ